MKKSILSVALLALGALEFSNSALAKQGSAPCGNNNAGAGCAAITTISHPNDYKSHCNNSFEKHKESAASETKRYNCYWDGLCAVHTNSCN